MKDFDFDNIDSLIGHRMVANNVSVHKHLEELREFLLDSNILNGIVYVNGLMNAVWNILQELHIVSINEWRQRVIAAYSGNDFIDYSIEESIKVHFLKDKADTSEEVETNESCEEVSEADCNNWQCLQCKYYKERFLRTDSMFPIGEIPALSSGIGVQSMMGWCSLYDTPIDENIVHCTAFCKNESVSDEQFRNTDEYV